MVTLMISSQATNALDVLISFYLEELVGEFGKGSLVQIVHFINIPFLKAQVEPSVFGFLETYLDHILEIL